MLADGVMKKKSREEFAASQNRHRKYMDANKDELWS